MSVAFTTQPLYLACRPDPAFATAHLSAAGTGRDTAVILCPPFGWDEVCCYRSLRLWADRLARDGHCAIRLSFPGTGDSGGSPHDPDRVGAWVAAVTSAAAWLRAHAGARRVVAIGIGLGGMVACLSAAEGAGVDDLVLWATPARGRALVRHLRAFARLEHAQIYEGVQAPAPPATEELESGGYVLSSETIARLETIDLGRLDLPGAAERRALLLERDGLAVDPALRERLEACGIAVTVASGPGFADMTSHPQEARAPLTVIECVQTWLDAGSGPITDPPAAVLAPGAAAPGSPAAELAPGAPEAASAVISVGDGAVRETPVTIAQPFGRLSAVLVEPLQPHSEAPCVVLLNAGAMRRIGPNRMWVEAARRWGALGVTTLRLDVQGIGDADGDDAPLRDDSAFYTPEFVPQVLSALDFLEARGAGDRFVLGGLCSGAYWAFHAALRDSRVVAAMLINPRALIWTADLGPGRDLRALVSQPFSPAKIRRLATGPRLRSFLRWSLAAPIRWLRRLASGESRTAAVERDLDAALDAFVASGTRALLLFSDHEPVADELALSGRAERVSAVPSVSWERIGVRDHTMRPSWAQRDTHAALDRVIERELESGLAPSA